MEKRVVLAIILSVLVLIGYQYFFVKPALKTAAPPVAAPTAGPEGPQGKVEGQAAPPAVEAAAPEKAQPAPDLKPVSAQAEEEIVVETSLYRAVWSNKGGVLKSWRLKKHFSDAKEPVELVPAAAGETGKFPFSLGAEDGALAADLNAAFFETSGKSVILEDGAKNEIHFSFSDGKSVRAEKTFRFTGGSYEVGIELHLWKAGREIPASLLWGPGIGNPTPKEIKNQVASANKGAAVYAGGKVYRMDERRYKAETSAYNFADWAAYEENYFAAIFFFPAQKGQAEFLQQVRGQSQKPLYFVSASAPQTAFIGPKDFEFLKAFGRDAKKIISFGAFGAIAEILLAAVKLFHRLIPNWGAAIIILTLVIKILFFPLTYSSTKSMAKMAELQPKIKALQAKYKKAKRDIDQRRQMNEEMMKLYKEHGVNPAGGCLPLLIQLPIFWGVFRMLAVSVEFRQAPFCLWIKDLSIKDPYYVTPILMGITQYITQKMTPTSADPAQAKMMLLMPVIMTVFFLNFQSGLILYWLTTNVLQIAQQAIMNKMIAKHKRERDGKRA